MNTNIALISSPKSGETTFISEMFKDINSYAPIITATERSRAVSINSDLIVPHTYDLKVTYKDISNPEDWTFSLNDYNGILLKDKESAGPGYYEFEKDILNTNFWIILIDGDCFKDNSIDSVIKAIKKNHSRIIAPLLTKYIESHNGKLPEIMFFITKGSNISYGKELITHALMEAFKIVIEDRYIPVISLSDTLCDKGAGIAILTILNRIIQNNEKSMRGTASEASKLIGLALNKCYERLPEMFINGYDTFSFDSNLTNNMPETMPPEFIKTVPFKLTIDDIKDHMIAAIFDILFLISSMSILLSGEILGGLIGGGFWCGLITWYICSNAHKKAALKQYEILKKSIDPQLISFLYNKPKEAK